jgi:anti-sigma B factor antagonist
MNRVSAVGTGEGGLGSVRVTVRRSPSGERIVHVSGELLSDAVSGMSQLLAEQFMQSSSPLALNLAEVTRIDAAGVDVLTRAASVAGESDISFRLIATPDGLVRRALAALGLTELFEIYPPAVDT